MLTLTTLTVKLSLTLGTYVDMLLDDEGTRLQFSVRTLQWLLGQVCVLDKNMHARYTGVPGHLAYM